MCIIISLLEKSFQDIICFKVSNIEKSHLENGLTCCISSCPSQLSISTIFGTASVISKMESCLTYKKKWWEILTINQILKSRINQVEGTSCVDKFVFTFIFVYLVLNSNKIWLTV